MYSNTTYESIPDALSGQSIGSASIILNRDGLQGKHQIFDKAHMKYLHVICTYV